jgi:hypothetical protein
VASDWVKASSGHASTHFASSQNLQASAKLKRGDIRTTRILERIGFQAFSPFSKVQAYSQIPQPVHFEGATETNFLDLNLDGDILLIVPYLKYLNISLKTQVFNILFTMKLFSNLLSQKYQKKCK